MSDEEVKSSIGPGMGLCHLKTGVQVIIPAQIEPQRIVEAMEALLNALKNNVGDDVGCSDIAWMTSSDVNAMLMVSTGMDEGPQEAVAQLHDAAEVFMERAGRVKAQWEAEALKEGSEVIPATPGDDGV